MRYVGICAALALVLVSGSIARAGYITSYTMDVGSWDPITNVIAMDKLAGGAARTTILQNITGPGVVTIQNPLESDEAVSGSFLLGVMKLSDGDHLVMTLSDQGWAKVFGPPTRRFGLVWPAYREGDFREAVLTVTSGLPADDASVIAGWNMINSFASENAGDLYRSPSSALGLVRFSQPNTVPSPTAAVGGLLLVGLMGVKGLKKFRK